MYDVVRIYVQGKADRLRCFDVVTAEDLYSHGSQRRRRSVTWVTSPPLGSRVLRWACLSVCLSVSSCVSPRALFQEPKFSTRMLPVVVSLSSSDGIAVRYVLPVFWMTSCCLLMGTMAQATQVVWQTDRRTDCRTELQRHVPHYAVASYNQTFLQASSLNVLKDYYRLCRSEQMLYTLVSLNEFSHVGFTFVRVYLCVCAFIKDKFKWLYGPSCPVIFH